MKQLSKQVTYSEFLTQVEAEIECEILSYFHFWVI